jgi:IPT/TIG domain
MKTVRACLTFLCLLLTIGCSSAMPGSSPGNSSSGNNNGGGAGSSSVVISSMSPSTVAAGSPDVTITINGLNFGHFGHVSSTAFWTTNGNLHDTGVWLQTTIVSSSQLTAVIPAQLLQSPTSVQILVMNGDVMGMSDGYFGYPRSNSVTFTVTP